MNTIKHVPVEGAGNISRQWGDIIIGYTLALFKLLYIKYLKIRIPTDQRTLFKAIGSADQYQFYISQGRRRRWCQYRRKRNIYIHIAYAGVHNQIANLF